MRKEGPGWQGGGRGRGRRRHEGRRRHQAGGGEKVGRRIGAGGSEFCSFHGGRVGRVGARGVLPRSWRLFGTGVGGTRWGRDDEDDEGGLVGKGGGESHSTPSHATPRPGGKTTKTRRKKKRKNTAARRGKSKSQKPRRASTAKKPKTPPGRQASVVSDRPHQNKTTVLTWLGPGTTEAGGERRAREVWLRRRKRKASTLSYTACIPTLGKLECLSLSDIHPYLRSYVWLCLPAACPACSYVGTRGWRRVSKPQKAFAPPLSY